MKSKTFRLTPRRVDFDKALSLHRAGRLEDAGRLYEQLLAADPGNASAWHFLGVVYHQLGKSDAAVANITRALELDPRYADACNNLGNIYRETDQYDAALRAYERAVEIAPHHADAWNNIGAIRSGRGDYAAAEQAYARALEIDPAHAAAWQNRGSLSARVKQFEASIAAYRRAIELRPRDANGYDGLSRALYRAGRIDEAVAVYKEWLAVTPDNAVARHMLAACTGAEAPERASDNFVRNTFDAFAGSFDRVLDQLGYRAPALIAAFLDREVPATDVALVIADAGCGTGLCAEFLRRRATRLVGVDLSAGMLTRARARNSYDELIESELAAWLAGRTEEFDLIVSADTLCYFGALEQAVAAAARALRPGGRVVFTVERAAEDVREYKLDATGRYSHAENYVREVLAGAGLESIAIEHVVLRQERGLDVNGLLASARRK
ncbi:MAG TPA: tetratricopeptide repeat protein [Vicinamibacterales bacterium]|nr:tetratricopeptide repeat protein [Vicinamibacterales bacterium]